MSIRHERRENNPIKKLQAPIRHESNDYWHDPKEFGPNYQHNLAGKNHFATGGSTKNWIKGAIKHPGGLHKSLHVAEDKPIPMGKLEKATHAKSSKTRKQANLALTLKGFHHRG